MDSKINNNVGEKFKAYFKTNTLCADLYKTQTVEVMLVQFTPTFGVVKYNLSYLDLFGELGPKLLQECEKLGVRLNSQKLYLEVFDYSKLLSAIFYNYTCENHEGSAWNDPGHPDLKFISNNSDHSFYVEIKKNADGIRNTQLKWLIKNDKCEVYFLFIKDSVY